MEREFLLRPKLPCVHTSGYQSAEVSAGWRRLFLVDCPSALTMLSLALRFSSGVARLGILFRSSAIQQRMHAAG
jgi:hypothetical protein